MPSANRCPTDPRCVLAGDQHDDWTHADADGNEWPVTAEEAAQAGSAADAALAALMEAARAGAIEP